MEYIIKNKESGCIEHYCTMSKELPKGAIRVDDNWKGIVGEPNEFYNANGLPFDDAELFDKGLIEDNRGIWFDSKKNTIEIKDYGKLPEGSEFTKEKPNHITDKLVKGTWIEQKEDKKEFIKKEKVGTAKSYLQSTDWYISREMETKEAVPKEIKKLRKEARDFLNEAKL